MNDLDFTPLTKAGVAVSHFARVCGVSRFAVYGWIKQAHEPRGPYRRVAATVLKAVDRALERGTLPLPDTRRGDDTYDALVKALRN